MFCDKLQLELPDAFPCLAYEAFLDASRAILLPCKGNPWREFAGASNLIAWRFRASSEYLNAYLCSWEELGTNISFEELYSRERNMFGMFVSGASCVESLTYAVGALASHPRVLSLPFGEREQRTCTPKALRDRLKNDHRAAAMVEALDELLNSQGWKLWMQLRNRMTHRSNLPRRHYASTGPEPVLRDNPQHFAATASTPDIPGDTAWFRAQFVWLGHCVELLLNGGRNLASYSK